MHQSQKVWQSISSDVRQARISVSGLFAQHGCLTIPANLRKLQAYEGENNLVQIQQVPRADASVFERWQK